MSDKKYEKYLTDLIAEYLPRNFKGEDLEILLDTPQSELPLTGKTGLRRMLGEIDREFFARAYLPHYMDKPICGFHREQFKEMAWIEKQKGRVTEVIAAPRESAKSTLWSTIYSIHTVCYKLEHYVVLISDSTEQAEEDLSKLKEEFEHNEYLIEDFGRLQGNKTWKASEIITSTNIKVTAKGSGKKVRGIKHGNYRPGLVILDDIENDEAVESPEQRRKLLNWFNKAVEEIGSKNTRLVVVGTILHYDSLLSTILKRPGYRTRKYKAVIKESNSPLWDKWEKIYTDLEDDNRTQNALKFFKKNEEEMMRGVEVIWPEGKSYYFYREKIINSGIAAFNSEYQNEPLDPSMAWVLEDDFQFYKDNELPDLKDCVVKASLDPSLGKNSKADPSAIVTVAKDRNGYLYVLESDAQIRRPNVIIKELIDKQRRYQYQEVYVEAVQFQDLLADNLREESAKAGVYLNVITEPKPKGDKIARIKSLQPMIKNGYLRFHSSQKSLIQELVYLTMWKHDDQADALHMVVQLFLEVIDEKEHSLLPMISGVSIKR